MFKKRITMRDNKLIAEFMGMSSNTRFLAMTVDAPYDDSWMVRNTPQGNEVIPIDALQYDSSWNWLMPVIDKCYQEHMSKHITDAVMTCDINKAYKVVVEFIHQYNKDCKL